jgi:hypothetical protein
LSKPGGSRVSAFKLPLNVALARPSASGWLSFLLASLIGAVSGVLIAPLTTIYYDTGFLIALKSLLGAIIDLADIPRARRVLLLWSPVTTNARAFEEWDARKSTEIVN